MMTPSHTLRLQSDASAVSIPWAGSSISGASTGDGRLKPATARVTVITSTQRVACALIPSMLIPLNKVICLFILRRRRH
ncbi:hypothetical protein D3C76_1445650 [compost metagenome]